MRYRRRRRSMGRGRRRGFARVRRSRMSRRRGMTPRIGFRM